MNYFWYQVDWIEILSRDTYRLHWHRRCLKFTHLELKYKAPLATTLQSVAYISDFLDNFRIFEGFCEGSAFWVEFQKNTQFYIPKPF